ncbi:MAG TPA: PA14 domain-containing protein, partial [Thermomicrobiales bacterium]|nr:PA14 domain-containing protein [Thermomicrobiales bacterium]
GGHFGINQLEQQVCGNQFLSGLASLNADTGQLYCDWIPQLAPSVGNGNGPRAEMAVTNNSLTNASHLWVGGGFNDGVSGVPQKNFARFDINAKAANYAKPKVDLNGLQQNSGIQRGGLNATYWDNADFTGPQVDRIDTGVNFDWGGGSPDPSIGSDTFSARWTGQVEAPVSGDYTFTTTSDDGVRLSVDGKPLVDNWTDHGPTDDSGTVTLQAGQKYDVQMEFFENGGGAMLRLAWEYPGQARQIVPANNLFHSADGTGGLDVTYWDNIDFTGTQVSRVEPTINAAFGDGSPDPGIGPDTFSARWTGQVEAPVSGDYTFTTTGDDGVRLFVDGKTVVENWSDRAPTDDSGTITLEAGKRYDIQFDYYENGGGAMARLAWEYPGQTRQVVPARNLFYSGNVDYSAVFGGGPTSIVDRANLAVTDADDINLASAKVTLVNPRDGAAESLSVDTSGTPIAGNYDPQTGVLSLSGKASKADYQKVLGTVLYNNTSAAPSPENRRVTFVVDDGFDRSGEATATIAMRANTP